ncbi:hypothetical protein BASA81_012140 [Batrachochytrium salamandrivorans]|nr:hypothetical protein BASA81_012140 [Batrachochytrium salamandrivorans]
MPLWCYFEQQEASLCGQHLLNNLLQGPYFQASDLGQIALELDQQEIALGLREPHGQSQNVDLAGNFSIQVLETALERQFGLALSRDCAPALKSIQHQDLSKMEQTAFVFNFHDHWFCARWLGGSAGDFYELNSLKDSPKLMSKTILGMTVSQMQTEGWSVFLVQGDRLPAVVEQPGEAHWVNLSPEPPAKKQAFFQGKAYSMRDEEREDGELAKALRLSLVDFDAKLMEALEPEPLSSGSEPVITIQLLLPPTGKRVRRRFPTTASTLQVFAWAKTEVETGKGFQLHLNGSELALEHPLPLTAVGNASIRVIVL